METLAPRHRFADRLAGRGLDLGPGHQPFACPPGVTVLYVDRWDPERNQSLFPELGGAAFPRPDVVTDFDTTRLAPIADESQDFVICSHVLEHLAEPLGFLAEIHRVLRPGGVALILLPDRRKTFDRRRAPTSLAHVVAEYDAGVTRVDDKHICEFLTYVGPELLGDPVGKYLEIPERRSDRPAFFEWHRHRSIHVHCWTHDEFIGVINYGIESLGQHWSLIDDFDSGEGHDEFGFALRRNDDTGRSRAHSLARRFRVRFGRSRVS